MKRSLRGKGREDFTYAVIASCKQNPSLDGLNVAEAAKATRGSASLDDQIETILEIQKNGGASAVFHGMNEDDLQTFMRHPNTMVACDSGVRKFGEGVPHPRGYGNNARVLARYVRELKVLRLEDAIRKMTSLPANTFHFADRASCGKAIGRTSWRSIRSGCRIPLPTTTRTIIPSAFLMCWSTASR